MSDPGIIPPPESTVPAPQPSAIAKIFRGPNGIRAGWRVVLFLALMAAFVLVATLPFVLLSRMSNGGARFLRIGISALSPLGLGISEALIFLFPSLAALVMARIEHRTYGDYGLPARFAFRKHFWVGTLVGFASISTALFGIFALHGFRVTGLALHGSTIATATAAWSVTFIIVGLAEEFSFRGYLQFALTTGMGFWPSAILLSAVFALAHKGNPGESIFGLLSVFCFGMLFCLFLYRTGNLWLAVGFHAGWDWGQTFFYGVPDSGLAPYHNLFNSSFSGSRWLTGGTVGPEASVFTPLVLLIVAILFARVYHGNRYYPSRTSEV